MVEAIAPPPNTYKNGTNTMGFGANMAWGMELAPANQQPAQIAHANVSPAKNSRSPNFCANRTEPICVSVSDPYNDVRYYGQLKFPFPKNGTRHADEVMKSIEEVCYGRRPSRPTSRG